MDHTLNLLHAVVLTLPPHIANKLCNTSKSLSENYWLLRTRRDVDNSITNSEFEDTILSPYERYLQLSCPKGSTLHKLINALIQGHVVNIDIKNVDAGLMFFLIGKYASLEDVTRYLIEGHLIFDYGSYSRAISLLRGILTSDRFQRLLAYIPELGVISPMRKLLATASVCVGRMDLADTVISREHQQVNQLLMMAAGYAADVTELVERGAVINSFQLRQAIYGYPREFALNVIRAATCVHYSVLKDAIKINDPGLFIMLISKVGRLTEDEINEVLLYLNNVADPTPYTQVLLKQ